MGNCVGLKQTIQVNSSKQIVPLKSKNTTMESRCKPNSNSVFSKITHCNLLQVLDYLKFDELREVGKINGYLNQSVKSDKILIKFFKRREEPSSAQLSFNNESTNYIEHRNSICSFGSH